MVLLKQGRPEKKIEIELRHRIRDMRLQQGNFTEIVKRLETGDITDGKLNGITFDNKAVKIGQTLVSDAAYYQKDDGILVEEYPWIVCGFNGAVPEYVKYLADDERYFVKATDENNVERTIQNGDSVYTRSWNAHSLGYEYTKVGTVASQSGEFKYGGTNPDYGVVSIKDPYAVPTNIEIKLGSGDIVLPKFAGYNMQLYSDWLLFDANSASSIADAKMLIGDATCATTYHYRSWTGNVSSSWSKNPIREVCNDTGDVTTCEMTQWNDDGYRGFKGKCLRTRMSECTDVLLPNICKQVNRNWTYGGTIESTVDWFWLAGADLLADSPIGYWASESGAEAYFPDRIIGLCKEKEFSNQKGAKQTINGSQGQWHRSYEVFRSANKVWDGSGTGYYSFDNCQRYLVWNPCGSLWPKKGEGGLARHTFGQLGYYGIAPCCSIG